MGDLVLIEGNCALFTAVSLPRRRRSSSSTVFDIADGEVEYMVYCNGYTNCHEPVCDGAHHPAVVKIEISVAGI